MPDKRLMIHEDEVVRQDYSDRWSKDLIGGMEVLTTNGFNVGVAEYHAEEFGPLQTHDDQEALYVLSGIGQVRIGDSVHDVRPGCALYVAPHTEHATRRTGEDPVKVVYTHGAV